MVLIAGPNLTIDRTLGIDELRPGEVLRFRSAAITPGGKGVNVARVARTLGVRAVLVGFVPGHTGAAAVKMLGDERIDVRTVPVAGEVRSTSIILEQSGRVTVLNEPGPQITDRDWATYESLIEREVGGHRALVCTGSVPPGAPSDAYGRLVAIGREAGVLTLVDAAGPLLRGALAAGPTVVTPNLSEAERLLDRESPDGVTLPVDEARERSMDAAARLVELGAELAVVTAGAAGLALAGDGGSRWLAAPNVAPRNPVGAGDSLVGGFVAAVEQGMDRADAVLFGAATAAASVEQALAGGIDPRRARDLASYLEWAGRPRR